jgi:FtsZ-binding cell division protein ZapB
MDSPDYNRFLALQLKMQKARTADSLHYPTVISAASNLSSLTFQPNDSDSQTMDSPDYNRFLALQLKMQKAQTADGLQYPTVISAASNLSSSDFLANDSDSKTMDSPDYNRFLALQLKMQKARSGFEVKLLSPIELDAVAYLTYDLRSYVFKPIAICPAFELISIPIASITSMTTTEPTSARESNPQVHLRLALPPFRVSISFSRDCRSFATFLETIEFIRLSGNVTQVPAGHREIQELREANEDLNNEVEQLRMMKHQQDQVIEEMSRLLGRIGESES